MESGEASMSRTLWSQFTWRKHVPYHFFILFFR